MRILFRFASKSFLIYPTNSNHIRPIHICRSFLTLLLLSGSQVFAQGNSSFKPEKVSPEDFNITSPLITPGTGAIVIADIGAAALERKDEGWTILFKRTKRLKILSQAGFEACTISLQYSADDNRNNKLKDLKAATYNLNADKVEMTSLSSDDIFITREKKSDLIEEKFTFPAVKVGSIIEYSYSVRYSDILDLYPWNFQGKYPTLWTEYAVTIPGVFNYTKIMQGLLPFYQTSVDSVKRNVWIGTGSINMDVYTLKWSMKDVPEIKTEPMVYCPDNYVSKIHFQIARSPVSGYGSRTRFRSWQYLANYLLEWPFGQAAEAGKSWLKDTVTVLTQNCSNDLDKAKKIFAYVRDNYQSIGTSVHPYTDPKKAFTSRKGTSADLNLMLTAMLRTAGITADPVLLATRSSGKIIQEYPVLENID